MANRWLSVEALLAAELAITRSTKLEWERFPCSAPTTSAIKAGTHVPMLLDALVELGELDRREADVWLRRWEQAQHFQSQETLGGTILARRLPNRYRESSGRFLGVVAGPGQELPLPGGARARICAVEMYERMMAITLRIWGDPIPQPSWKHGVNTDAWAEYRARGHERTEISRLQMADDLGNVYRLHNGGGPMTHDYSECVQSIRFTPGLRTGTRSLTFHYESHSVDLPVRLADGN